MTRFARAKGSKSSNEKTPEEPTSWAEMRKSVLDKSAKFSNIEEVDVNQIQVKTKSTEPKKSAEWAQLDSDTVENYFTLIRKHHSKDEAKNIDKGTQQKKKHTKVLSENRTGDMKPTSSSKAVTNKVKKKKKKIVKNQLSMSGADLSCGPKDINDSTEIQKLNKKKRKLLEKSQEEPCSKKKFAAAVNSSKQSEKVSLGKNKKSNSFKHKDDFVGIIDSKPSGSAEKNKKNNKLKKKENERAENNKKFSSQLESVNASSNRVNSWKKKNKFSQGNQDQNHGIEEIIVNGQKIQITKFQGFYVTAEDAERLKKLRSDMFKEGIPKDKLEAALKLERRRAEKALARLKKAVCFHCRRSGHVLSECPLITESENAGTGICYKCGSTEHTALECKVVRGSNFQFAECFICKEQGHIAKQCPDNPRGLYPHGGGCRECGDVTHLRKDCPKAVVKKEEETMTVGLRNERNLESLDEEMLQDKEKRTNKASKKKSVVKF